MKIYQRWLIATWRSQLYRHEHPPISETLSYGFAAIKSVTKSDGLFKNYCRQFCQVGMFHRVVQQIHRDLEIRDTSRRGPSASTVNSYRGMTVDLTWNWWALLQVTLGPGSWVLGPPVYPSPLSSPPLPSPLTSPSLPSPLPSHHYNRSHEGRSIKAPMSKE